MKWECMEEGFDGFIVTEGEHIATFMRTNEPIKEEHLRPELDKPCTIYLFTPNADYIKPPLQIPEE